MVQLVKAAIVTGHPRDRFENGPFSLVEMLARAATLWSSLRITDDRFVRTGVYRAADRSEKAGISYTLGQTLAHLFATRLLDVPYTMHVDRYWEEVELVWERNARRRPDLIGRGRSWVVIEAKGRTWGIQGNVLENAIEQKGTVLAIGGEAPGLSLAMVTHFADGALALRVRDPEGDEESVGLPGDPATFLRTYYQPFVDATRGGRRRRFFGRDVLAVRFPGLDLSIGLETSVAAALRRTDATLVRTMERLASETQSREQADEHRTIGGDGVVLELGPSWRDAIMSLEPWDRASKLAKR
jgi:hypothetical protein